jgi:hypothetical protein
VIYQSMTFSAQVANPILYLGATPVFYREETEIMWNLVQKLLCTAYCRIQKGKTQSYYCHIYMECHIKLLCKARQLNIKSH